MHTHSIAKPAFAGPEAELAYLSRYTHRAAISNSRLVAMGDQVVCFRWKDYWAKGRTLYKTMTMAPQELMRRFLLHVLPCGFTASGTTGCSPMAAAAPTSRGFARHCRSKSSRRPWTSKLRHLPCSRHLSSSATTAVGRCSSC